MARQYYMLVTSLPHLDHFASADVLPIGRERLDGRMKMLHPEDAADLEMARAVMHWQEQPVRRTDEQVGRQYREARERTRNRALREILDFRIGMRIAMAGLRRRRRGLDPLRHKEHRGLGPLVHRIESNWDADDLGLGGFFPWLETARGLLEAGDALKLEHMLMDRVWKKLRRSADLAGPFGFERVFAYVFQWDIVHRWLSYNAEAAAVRFQKLISEVTRDHQQLFA